MKRTEAGGANDKDAEGLLTCVLAPFLVCFGGPHPGVLGGYTLFCAKELFLAGSGKPYGMRGIESKSKKTVYLLYDGFSCPVFALSINR